ncbi:MULTISPECIES: cytochrome-c oxidase, cbb3-type subunit III [unclassified Moraxella]|uniref:cytochrome-c oxidase, cbb3-type subunit III n=1 Tax=unclassified Moraxella TaxID=2685852 RepID=UPI003AF424E3
MSLFWSIWVTILSLGCWLWILWWLAGTLNYRPTMEDDGTTGHVYDGIQEYDRPLPKWWLVIFWGTLAWGLLYFVLFPSIMPERWKGITTVKVDGQEVPWTSANELASDLQSNNAVFIKTFNDKILQDAGVTAQLASLKQLQDKQAKNATPDTGLKTEIDKQIVALAPAVEKLSQNPQAIKIGQRLFLQNCSVCHGSQARGATGYPNLTDNDWIYGGTPEKILQTIQHGRVGGMPAWKAQIGEDGVRAAAEYVLSLSPEHGSKENGELNQTMVTQGKAIFEANCAVCHGKDGKGSKDVGALNLTDNTWLYGGDRETVRTTVRNGRAGVMPHWDSKLGNERIMLLSAYVYSLAETKDKPATTVVATATATPASTAK